MNRTCLAVALTLAGLIATGCPGDSESSCATDIDCPDSYVCDTLLELCRPIEVLACQSPADCSDATCSFAGHCVAAACNAENVGCVAGSVCSDVNGTWSCVPAAVGQGGAGGAAGDAGASGEQSAGGVPTDGSR